MATKKVVPAITRLPDQLFEECKEQVYRWFAEKPMSYTELMVLIDQAAIQIPVEAGRHQSFELSNILSALREEERLFTDIRYREHRYLGQVPEVVYSPVITGHDAFKSLVEKRKRDFIDNIIVQQRGEHDHIATLSGGGSPDSMSSHLASGTFLRKIPAEIKIENTGPDKETKPFLVYTGRKEGRLGSTKVPGSKRTTHITNKEYIPHTRFVAECESAPDVVWTFVSETTKDSRTGAVFDTYGIIGNIGRNPKEFARVHELSVAPYFHKILAGLQTVSERTATLAEYSIRIVDGLLEEKQLYQKGKRIVNKTRINHILSEVNDVYWALVAEKRGATPRGENTLDLEFGKYSYPLARYMLTEINGKTQKNENDRMKMGEMLEYVRHRIYEAAEQLQRFHSLPVTLPTSQEQAL